MIKPKILLIDLETLPNLKEVMRVFPQIGNWPGRTLKSDLNSIICFGYKWYGNSSTKCINAWDFPSWDKDINDDKELVLKTREIIESADVIVTHNGKKFDWKVFQTRLYINRLPPLPKIPHVDTREMAKRHLFLFDNKLNTVARGLGIQKLENGGWSLWEKVISKDPVAMKLMTKYCKQDIRVLESVFKELLPFVSQLPNFNILRRDGVECCPQCGGFDLLKQGTRLFKHGLSQQYKCSECGSWSHVKLDKINKNKNYPKVL